MKVSSVGEDHRESSELLHGFEVRLDVRHRLLGNFRRGQVGHRLLLLLLLPDLGQVKPFEITLIAWHQLGALSDKVIYKYSVAVKHSRDGSFLSLLDHQGV